MDKTEKEVQNSPKGNNWELKPTVINHFTGKKLRHSHNSS